MGGAGLPARGGDHGARGPRRRGGRLARPRDLRGADRGRALQRAVGHGDRARRRCRRVRDGAAPRRRIRVQPAREERPRRLRGRARARRRGDQRRARRARAQPRRPARGAPPEAPGRAAAVVRGLPEPPRAARAADHGRAARAAVHLRPRRAPAGVLAHRPAHPVGPAEPRRGRAGARQALPAPLRGVERHALRRVVRPGQAAREGAVGARAARRAAARTSRACACSGPAIRSSSAATARRSCPTRRGASRCGRRAAVPAWSPRTAKAVALWRARKQGKTLEVTLDGADVDVQEQADRLAPHRGCSKAVVQK